MRTYVCACENPMKTRIVDNKEYVFCEWRRKFVRLTPEEYVRQTFLSRLVADYGYPKEKIAVEVFLGGKRADAVVYAQALQPVMIIEFKAETVPLTQKTLDQAAVYNRQLQVPYLILHNGPASLVAHITDQIQFLKEIPSYSNL